MRNIFYTSLIFLILLFPETIFACATCFGAPDAMATKGMNKAIVMMLGITGGVLSGFGSLIYVLNQRAKKYAQLLKREKNKR